MLRGCCKGTLRIKGALPRGSIVVPVGGSYIESYKVIPNWNYYGASGYEQRAPEGSVRVFIKVQGFGV